MKCPSNTGTAISSFVVLVSDISVIFRKPLCLQLEDNLEREKKVRADTEKAKKKVEQDLRDTQAAVEELEGIKSDLEGNVKR